MNKRLLEKEEENICKEYVSGTLSIENLSKKYHIGKIKIKEILKNNEIEIKKAGGKKSIIKNVLSDYKIEKYPIKEGFHYIAIDKNKNYETNDYMNKGGFLTKHIKKAYNKESSLHERRKYYMATGDYWWEQWFDIIEVENSVTKKCPYCDWETIDVNNRSGSFEQHLLQKHNISKIEHLKKYPEDKSFFKTVVPIINRQFDDNRDNYVVCKICGKKLARIDNHHLKTHNITKYDYIKLYGDENILSKTYYERECDNMITLNKTMKFRKNSKAELEIKDFITKLGFKCKSNRTILNGKEIDIFIPDINLGIEYNGLKWHTEWFGRKDNKYHLNKLNICKNNNVDLINIFEDEYAINKKIVLSKIKHILLKDNLELPKIYGRKCIIRKIDSTIAKPFLETNHIQGFVKSSYYIGAFFNDTLIAVMTFMNLGDNKWELTRFASDITKVCCGVGGKLFSFFKKNINFDEVKSFADRRWTLKENDNIYVKLGFQLKSYIRPNYTYYNPKVNKYKRFHKSNFRKERIIKMDKRFNKNMTETEMMRKLGYDRIWDCGLLKYVYYNDTGREKK